MSGTTGGYNPLSGIDWGTKLGATNGAYTIKYYFYPAGQTVSLDDSGSDRGVNTTSWTDYQKQQVAAALQTISNVANITFSPTNDVTQATLRLALGPFPEEPNDPEAATLGVFSPPGEPGAGTGIFNSLSGQFNTSGPGPLDAGGVGFATLLHELGHGLGMAHPHDNGGTSTIWPGVTSDSSPGPYGLNQGIYTMMTYIDGWPEGPNGPPTPDSGNGQTPMAFDVAVLQQKYGANTNYRTGNDTYVLPGANAPGVGYTAIWDAGGTNTIQYNGSADAVIDLRPATLQYAQGGGGYASYVKGVNGGFTIAKGTVIQRAIGGSGNNLITGNDSGDFLQANGKNDTVLGGAGNDTIQATTGDDLIETGHGDSKIMLGSGSDTVMSAGAADTIFGGSGDASISDTGGDDVVFGGSGKISFLDGSAASTVIGGAGSDTLMGGTGGGLLEAGTGGGSLLEGGTGATTLLGGGSGDLLFAQGAETQLIIAGAGNETLVGVGASGTNVYAAGSGDDLIAGGSGAEAYFAGKGQATLIGGTGNDFFAFVNGQAGGNDVIYNLKPNDHVVLFGYGADAARSALDGAVTTSAGTTIALSDGTHVTFAGLPGVSSNLFVTV